MSYTQEAEVSYIIVYQLVSTMKMFIYLFLICVT